MTQTSSKVQEALCLALLHMLRLPDLTVEEAEWLERYAMRTIAEFNLLKSKPKKDTPEKPIAA